MEEAALTNKTFTLQAETELRIEVGPKDSVDITLVSGDAECFGTELARDNTYTLTNCRLAFFTWEGCDIAVNGVLTSIYVGTETPYPTYVNLHSQLERLRTVAVEEDRAGPRVMVVGNDGTGKSTLVRALLGWAVRHGRQPTHVDLDLAENAIAVPGCIAATPVEYPAGLLNLNGPGPQAPLAFFLGHDSPHANAALFHRALAALAAAIDLRLSQPVPRVRAAGCIVDTPGDLCRDTEDIVKVANALSIDVVVVLDNERLFAHLAELKDQLPSHTVLTRLQKSGGVVTPSPTQALEDRALRFRRYFYGHPGEPALAPVERKIRLNRVSLFTTTADSFAPSSALPLGVGASASRDRLLAVSGDTVKLNSIIAVTAAESSTDVGVAPALGFLHVKHVDKVEKTLTCLAPSGGHIPGHGRWLVGNTQWFDHF